MQSSGSTSKEHRMAGVWASSLLLSKQVTAGKIQIQNMQLLFYSILLNFYRIIYFFKSITTAGGEISCKSHQHLSQFLSHILWSFSLLVIHALPLTFLGFVLLIVRKDDTQSSLVEAYSKLVIIRHDNGTTGLRSQHNFSWLYFCDPKIMRVPMRNYINSKCNSKCKQYFKDIGDSETLS